MPSTDNPTIGPGSSPAPGCVILATILTVFGGLAILYTIVANVQNRRLGGFTEDQPAKIETFAPSAEQTEKANQKLGDLVRAALTNESDRVLFSADDLNTLIATRELLKDFRGQTFIRKIGAEGIEAEMSQPMRKGFFGGGRRYLNGTFVLKPELKGGTVLFRVADIRVPDREVPRAFVESYAALEFFRLDLKNEDFLPVLKKLGSVYLEGDSAVAETRVELQ